MADGFLHRQQRVCWFTAVDIIIKHMSIRCIMILLKCLNEGLCDGRVGQGKGGGDTDDK